jgi:two-component system, NtrC family, sensor histidine kinase HydH
MKEKDRLVMLGQMAAGLAHEIRNPLGAIKGAAQLLAEPSEIDGEHQQEFLGIIVEEVERLDNVVTTVLALARARQDGATAIDVNAVVRRTLQVMSTDWRDLAVEVTTSLEEDLPRATIEPDQLRQVLINLVQNAVQAMAGGGGITVASRTRRRGGTLWVAISVRDEGPGISRAALKNIFLPFFTTKDEGTGLGLAVSQRIVETAGGRIEVRSREGEGTTFEIVLPAAEAFGTPTPSKARAIEANVPGGDP